MSMSVNRLCHKSIFKYLGDNKHRFEIQPDKNQSLFFICLKTVKRLQSDRINALKKDLLYKLVVCLFSAFVWS